MVLTLVPMVASGYLIQTAVDGTWRKAWVVGHLIASALWLAGYRCLARCGVLLKRLGEPNAAAEALLRARLLGERGTGDPVLLEEIAQAGWI